MGPTRGWTSPGKRPWCPLCPPPPPRQGSAYHPRQNLPFLTVVQSVSGLPLAFTVHAAGGLSLEIHAPGAGIPRWCKMCGVSARRVQRSPETCPESTVPATGRAVPRTAMQCEKAIVVGAACLSFLSSVPPREACVRHRWVESVSQKNRICVRFRNAWYTVFFRFIFSPPLYHEA